MRRVLFVLLVALLAPAASRAAVDDRPSVSSAYTLLQLEWGNRPRAVALLRSHGARQVSPALRIWRLRSDVARRVAARLAATGAIGTFAPDVPFESANHITSGDPLLPSEWWLPVVGADRVEPPGPGRPVVVIDGGLDLSHPEFAGRPNTTVLNVQTVGRDQFHGTAVASVAAAPANGIGLVGVYPQADLRSWDASGGRGLTSGEVIAGIEAASASCPGVINMSVGSEGNHPLVARAVQLAVERGCVIVASAGNSRTSGSPRAFPASLPHVLTIGSVGRNGGVSFFSSASPALDLAAPGEDVWAAVPFATASSGFALMDGTSFSAPIVAGATAWIWTVRGLLDDTQIFDLMRLSARDIAPGGHDADTGFGVLDIPRALTAPIPPIDPLEPNEDVDLVKPNGLTSAGKPVLRGARTLSARLDLNEDPRDVYRIFVPGRRTVTMTVRGDRNVDVQLWRAGTSSVVANAFAGGGANRLAVSSRAGTAADTVRFRNRRSTGVFLYANVLLGARVGNANYSLSLRIVRP